MDSQCTATLPRCPVIFRYSALNVGGFELAKGIMVAQSMISPGPETDSGRLSLHSNDVPLRLPGVMGTRVICAVVLSGEPKLLFGRKAG